MCNYSRQFTGIKYMQTPTISTNLDSTNLIYAQPIEGDQFWATDASMQKIPAIPLSQSEASTSAT